jgi:hypothetical protein
MRIIDKVGERQLLEEEEECTMITALNTTYNHDERNSPYVGIMFEIFPRMDLELLTIEFDVRIPEDERDVDLSVEVYTMPGSFEILKAYESDRWTLVTETKAALLPGGGGAIIPAQAFNALAISARERRSFYVTMKKPYLDYNVMALDKTGELQMRTRELDLLVGVGLNEYKFPGDFDRTLDPQFAGVLHVRSTSKCTATPLLLSTTMVDYDFLLNQKMTATIMSDYNEYMDDAITNLMQTSSALLNYKDNFALKYIKPIRTIRMDYEGTMNDDSLYCCFLTRWRGYSRFLSHFSMLQRAVQYSGNIVQHPLCELRSPSLTTKLWTKVLFYMSFTELQSRSPHL